MAGISDERICPVCGKEFYATGAWGYKRGNIYICRYKCLREYEKGKKVRHHNRRLDKDEVREVRKLLEEGRTTKEIAMIIGARPESIAYYKQKAGA